MDADCVVYCVPHCEALALASGVGASGRKRYRKELIYAGDFVKKTPDKTIAFSVNKNLIDHWHKTHSQLIANGIEIPLPLAHIFDEAGINNPLNKRASCVAMEVGKNAKGLDSLYGIIEFKDDESEKALKDSDISVFVPGEFVDGKGNTYYRPIRHICFTDFPVIPGLEKFESLAASLTTLETRIDEMAKIEARNLAKLLGVNPDLNDSAMETAIEKAIADLQSELAKAKEKKPTGEDKKEPEPIAAAFVNIVKSDRQTKLQGLVEKAIITPAVKADLEKVFADSKTLPLALSLNADGTETVERDNFSKVVEALAKNDPVVLKEQTKQQTLSLSHNNRDNKEDTDNVLTQDAKERAAAAK